MKLSSTTKISMRQPARRSRAATTERAAVTCDAAVDRRVALTLVASLSLLRAPPPSSAEEGGIDTFGYAGDAGTETLNTCSMNKVGTELGTTRASVAARPDSLTCALRSFAPSLARQVSCISTLNDDEAHFAAPW